MASSAFGNGSQSEIYRGIFDNYGGTSGKIFDNYRGHYVGEVQIFNVFYFPM